MEKVAVALKLNVVLYPIILEPDPIPYTATQMPIPTDVFVSRIA